MRPMAAGWAEMLSQAFGDEEWLTRIDPPHREQTLHHQLLAQTKISDQTAKKSFGFGVTATKQQRLPTKRFHLDSAAFGAETIEYMKEWNDPNLTPVDRLLILQKQTVTAAMIVAGDESDPYITIVTNPSITKVEADDGNLGAPIWSDILQEELAQEIGVPYNRPSHLAAAGTGWGTRTGTVSSRDELFHKIQAVILHPAERFGSQHGTIHHALLFPALICPPVGFFWQTDTTFSEFVASITALNGTTYRSFLTVLELCRSEIEPWFDAVNASPADFSFRMQSAQPLIDALPTEENPIPDGIEDESLLDPILELVDKLLWPYYEDRVLTDCESKEVSTNASSQLHYLLRYGRMCIPESLTSMYGYQIPFLTYFLRPSKGWLMGVDHGALFSDKCHQAQWIQSYNPVKVPVVDNGSYEPAMIQTKLDLAIGKEAADKNKGTNDSTEVSDNPAKIVPLDRVSEVQQINENEEDAMVPAIIIRNVSPNADLPNVSRCIVNGIRKLHGEQAEVVSCYFIAKTKDTAKAFLEFTEMRHARMALKLDGIQVFSRTISLKPIQPGESTTPVEIPKENASLEKPKGFNIAAHKRELCTRHADGHCWLGDKCHFAHGVLDLRLNYQTSLHPERCLYIRNIALNYPSVDLLNFIRKKYEKSMHSSPEFTAIHVRGRMGDALVEFEEVAQALVARQILGGTLMSSQLRLEIYPWKPVYQPVFVAYFKDDSDIPIDVGRSLSPKSVTSEVSSLTDKIKLNPERSEVATLTRLKLETKRHPDRCLYIRNIFRNCPTANLIGFIRNKFKQNMHSTPEFTAIHLRGRMGDALVEFEEVIQASVARQILDGTLIGPNYRLEIYPWKPAYQPAFDAYFDEDRDMPIDVGRVQSSQSTISEGATAISLTAETKLHPERSVYIRNISRNCPAHDLMNLIRRQFEQSMHPSPEFTAIHARGRMRDAFVEFAEASQASVARQILVQVTLESQQLEVYPWSSSYQPAFVAYFNEDTDISIDVGSFRSLEINATSEVATVTSLTAEIQENKRKEKKLRQRLRRKSEKIKNLQEEKQQQDEVLQLFGASFHSMKRGLSTALSEIDSVLQQLIELQQVQATSVSNSSHATEAIKTEIERLQMLLLTSASTISDEGSQTSSLSGHL